MVLLSRRVPTPLALLPSGVLCAGNSGGNLHFQQALPCVSIALVTVPAAGSVLSRVQSSTSREGERDEEGTDPVGFAGQSNLPSVLAGFGVFGKRRG